MNLSRVFILLFLLLSHISFGQLSTGLVAHWNFSNNANDISGNNNNGTGTNITYTTGKSGVANTAVRFTGNNSYISVPYNSNMNVTNYSICAMVKAEGYYSGNCQANAILWRGSQWQNGYYSLIYFDNPWDQSCSTQDTSKNVFASQMGNLFASPSPLQWRYTPTIVTQKWYCVVTTFNGTQSKVYVDGVLMSTYNVSSGSIGTSTEGLAIGGNRFGGSSVYPYWMKGVVDDLRIYNRVLSSQDIAAYCGLFGNAITITRDLSTLTVCPDDTFHLPFTVLAPFNNNNVFTAELSDASGSFANPTSIGTLSSNNSGTITCIVPTINTSSTNYKVRIVASSPQESSQEESVTLYSNQPPSVTITASPSGPYYPNQYITFKSTVTNSIGTVTYQWKVNGKNVPGGVLDSLYINTLNNGDSVYVDVQDGNGCIGDQVAKSNILAVNINTSVDDIKLSNLLVYPNPTNGIVTITADNVDYNHVDITILNSLGQVVHQSNADIDNGQLNTKVNMSSHAQGIYLIRLSSNGIHRSIRVIKNN